MHANSLKLGLVAAFFVVNAGAQGEEVDDLSQYPSSPAFDANADWHRNVDQHEIRLSYFLDGDRRVAMRCVANLSSYQVETHREVYDHATQASKTRRLSHAQVLTLRELTRHLSASDAKPELANLLTVSLVEGETRRVITFDAAKPPAAVIRLYDLTGAYLPAAVEFRFDPMPQVIDGANSVCPWTRRGRKRSCQLPVIGFTFGHVAAAWDFAVEKQVGAILTFAVKYYSESMARNAFVACSERQASVSDLAISRSDSRAAVVPMQASA